MAKQLMKPRDVRGEIRRAKEVYVWVVFAELPDDTVDGFWLQVPKTQAMEVADAGDTVAEGEAPRQITVFLQDGALFIGCGYDPAEDDGLPEEEGPDEEEEEGDEEEDEEEEEPLEAG